jgi:hypothetical protein
MKKMSDASSPLPSVFCTDGKIVCLQSDVILQKAAKKIQDFLEEAYSLKLPIIKLHQARHAKRILLGTRNNLSEIRKLCDASTVKTLNPTALPSATDAYRVTQIGDDLWVLGSNERSVLYAAYRLADWLRGDREGQTRPDLFEQAYFNERWMNPTIHGRCDKEANFDYLSRLGVNATYLRGRYDVYCAKTNQGLRSCATAKKHLPVLSRLQPPHGESRRMMEAANRLAEAYGMETIVFTDEPKVFSPTKPEEAEIISRLNPNMLGYPAHKGYRTDGRLALSVFHPEVANHYRELLGDLLRRFPKLKYLYVYNQDVNADNCWPPTDPQGRGLYPKGYAKYPFAAHARLVQILQEQGRKLNKSFRVATGTWHWFFDPNASTQMIKHLPSEAVLCCLNANDDRAAIVEPRREIRHILKEARKRPDVKLIADDDFNGTSDDLLTTMTAGFPIPFRTYKKMRRWAMEGAVGITQHHTGGPAPVVNSLNDWAWRYFSWHPMVSPERAERKIEEWLNLQLGNRRAAMHMLNACQYIDAALDLDEKTSRPYLARLTHGLENTIVPLTPKGMPKIARHALSTQVYDNGAWHASLTKEIELLQKALHAAEAAERTSPTNRDPFHHWGTKIRLSCRNSARIQRESIEIVLRIKISTLHFVQTATASHASVLRKAIAEEKVNTRKLLAVLDRHRHWDSENYYGWLIEALRKKLKVMNAGRGRFKALSGAVWQY